MIINNELQKKDWYEILNENFKNVNKDFDNLNIKKKEIMNEQIKLNKVNILGSSLDNKLKSKKEINNKTEIGFSLPEESKLILNRLNLKNYKTKNYALLNSDTAFLKNILERIENNNTKKIFKSGFKSSIIKPINLSENKIINKTKFLTSRNNRIYPGIYTNEKKEKKIRNSKKKYSLLSKTFNNYRNNKSIDGINNTYFPKIKKIKNKNLNIVEDNKRKIMEMILNEEDNSVHRTKSIKDNILKLNKDFIKNKRLICGYKDKNEDYIIINNKKIYQLNPEKEINQKFRKNYLNIKKIEDIEKRLLNDSNNIFNKTRQNLILKYHQKMNSNNQ